MKNFTASELFDIGFQGQQALANALIGRVHLFGADQGFPEG
jgi:hypothetical protein